MKALVLHGPRRLRHETVSDPRLEAASDVILRVTATAIGGADVQRWSTVADDAAPAILGSEFVGVVEEVGSAVTRLRRGDRVFVPFPVSCGSCFYCHNEMSDHCDSAEVTSVGSTASTRGGFSGLGFSGGHADYVRVPFGNSGPRRVPDDLDDDQVLLLADALPAAWAAIDWGNPRGGEVVVVVGAGVVGLLAMKSARLRGAARIVAVDKEPWRLARARAAGACDDVVIAGDDLEARVHAVIGDTGGADIVIDAVGAEAPRSLWNRVNNVIHLQMGSINALRTCMGVVRPGGTISVVGVHPLPSESFPLARLFDSGVSLRMGKAPLQAYVDELVDHVRCGRLDLTGVVSHRLALADGGAGFEMFSRQAEGFSKVVLRP